MDPCFGGALGLAVLSAVASSSTSHVLQSGGALPVALTAGFQRAFLIGTAFVVVAAIVAFLATNTRAAVSPPQKRTRQRADVQPAAAPQQT